MQKHFYQELLSELQALRALRQAWQRPSLAAMGERESLALPAREQARLARYERTYAREWHERTRERVARERQRKPTWREEDVGSIHKRSWLERRERDWMLIDARERVWQEQAHELSRFLPLYRRRLAELAQLDGSAAEWCRQMERDELEPPSAEDLDALWLRYRTACQARAKQLLQQQEWSGLRQRLQLASEAEQLSMLLAEVEQARIDRIAGLVAALIYELT
jgi:hypothetical protein